MRLDGASRPLTTVAGLPLDLPEEKNPVTVTCFGSGIRIRKHSTADYMWALGVAGPLRFIDDTAIFTVAVRVAFLSFTLLNNKLFSTS